MTAMPAHPGQWAHDVRASFFPLALHLPGGDARDVHMAAKVRGHCRLARVDAPRHTALMRAPECERLGTRVLKILWLQAGQAQFRQGGRPQDLQAGQWLLYEASRPYELDMSDGVRFVVLLAETSAQDRWLPLTASGELGAQPTTDAAELALGMVESALSERVGLHPATEQAFVWGVRHLLDTALPPDWRAPSAPTGSLLQRARQRLQDHLGDADYGPDDLAAALGVSRRTLYTAFEAAGESPQAWLLHQRLARCHALLQAPGGERLKLTALALEHGFCDGAHFSRAFKQRYGVAPSAVQGRG